MNQPQFFVIVQNVAKGGNFEVYKHLILKYMWIKVVILGLLFFGIFVMCLYFYKKHCDQIDNTPLLVDYLQYQPPTNHLHSEHTGEI